MEGQTCNDTEVGFDRGSSEDLQERREKRKWISHLDSWVKNEEQVYFRKTRLGLPVTDLRTQVTAYYGNTRNLSEGLKGKDNKQFYKKNRKKKRKLN